MFINTYLASLSVPFIPIVSILGGRGEQCKELVKSSRTPGSAPHDFWGLGFLINKVGISNVNYQVPGRGRIGWAHSVGPGLLPVSPVRPPSGAQPCCQAWLSGKAWWLQ